jgi:DNA repair exonuclease SbcCD ATPase subunit
MNRITTLILITLLTGVTNVAWAAEEGGGPKGGPPERAEPRAAQQGPAHAAPRSGEQGWARAEPREGRWFEQQQEEAARLGGYDALITREENRLREQERLTREEHQRLEQQERLRRETQARLHAQLAADVGRGTGPAPDDRQARQRWLAESDALATREMDSVDERLRLAEAEHAEVEARLRLLEREHAELERRQQALAMERALAEAGSAGDGSD